MPTTCGFPNCKFRARYKEIVDNRHFYRVPKKPDILRSKWLEAIGRTENNIVGQLRICSRHFLGGEKQDGDVPVADPESNPPLRIDLPSRQAKKFGILKKTSLKYTSQINSSKTMNKIKNTSFNNSFKNKSEYLPPVKQKLIGNTSLENENIYISQIYWTNCMKIMQISGMMFTSMMMANIQSLYKRPTVLIILSTLETQNFHGLEEFSNIHVVKEEGLRNSFEIENWNPSAIIVENNFTKLFSKLWCFSSLKHIVKLGNNFQTIDTINTFSEFGISVSVIPPSSIDEMSNITLVLIFCLLTNIPFSDSKTISDFVDIPHIATVLASKTIGLFGLDPVAISVARKAKLYGLSVNSFDSNNLIFDGKDPNITRVNNLEYFLKSSDCISVHLESSCNNFKSINSKFLRRMKSGSCIVNISSPKLFEFQDLQNALLNGYIRRVSINIDTLTSSQILNLTSSNITLVSMNKLTADLGRKEIIVKAIQEVRQGLIGYLPGSLQYCVNSLAIYNMKFRNSFSTRMKNYVDVTLSKNLTSHDKEILTRIFSGEDLRDFDDETIESANLEPLDPEIVKQEVEAIKLAEMKKYDEALEVLGKIIHLNPNYASAFNNRAQVYQLLKQNEDAMNDLNRAIELNGGLGKVGIQALTQRGIIYKYLGEDKLAMEDWERASKLGGQFARRLVIINNPYAALCNQMLSKMISEVRCEL